LKISVIFTTYNSPKWLEKVIWGFSVQDFSGTFEIIIADDGSKPETKELIEKLKNETKLVINHIWQEDNGFQKCMILNKAILASKYDYLVFTDGDCIPRKDFLSVHAKYAEIGCLLSGGYFKLPMETSQIIQKEDILSQKCFDINWLEINGLAKNHKKLKLIASGFLSKFLNFITPTNASWNGHNASGWKSDIFAVGGFDERMQYGGQDRELGERMFNSGIKSKQIRYSAICIHLDHKRGYVNQESLDKNRAIRNETKSEKKTFTEFGIKL
jgi:glycosyltransferase involved in cell wall biosynthesis